MVRVDLNGKPVEMDIDTGATVSIMFKQKFNKLFPGTHICKSKVALRMYTGEATIVLGEILVKVSYQQQPTQDLKIVEGSGLSLFGRKWLQHFQLDWFSIKAVLPCQRYLTYLLGKYHKFFGG